MSLALTNRIHKQEERIDTLERTVERLLWLVNEQQEQLKEMSNGRTKRHRNSQSDKPEG